MGDNVITCLFVKHIVLESGLVIYYFHEDVIVDGFLARVSRKKYAYLLKSKQWNLIIKFNRK